MTASSRSIVLISALALTGCVVLDKWPIVIPDVTIRTVGYNNNPVPWKPSEYYPGQVDLGISTFNITCSLGIIKGRDLYNARVVVQTEAGSVVQVDWPALRVGTVSGPGKEDVTWLQIVPVPQDWTEDYLICTFPLPKLSARCYRFEIPIIVEDKRHIVSLDACR